MKTREVEMYLLHGRTVVYWEGEYMTVLTHLVIG